MTLRQLSDAASIASRSDAACDAPSVTQPLTQRHDPDMCYFFLLRDRQVDAVDTAEVY